MGNNKNATDDQKREMFRMEPANMPFKAMADTTFIMHSNLAKFVNYYFHQVFADYEGCKFVGGGQEPTLELYFNHGEYGEKVRTACERVTAKVGNDWLARSRARDFIARQGDRYTLTDDGKDALVNLLTHQKYNNGNPNFNNIISEITERDGISNYYTNQTPKTFTCVSFISLNRICALLFGDKFEDEAVEYDCKVAAIRPSFGAMSPNGGEFIYMITRVTRKVVADFYNELGIGQSSSGIIR